MALKSALCIVHHAMQARAHCPTMILSVKLASGTVSLPTFCRRAVHILYIEKNLRLILFHRMHCCNGRSVIVHHARR